jgi:phenylalanyl-tRNA synthetase alpha chain
MEKKIHLLKEQFLLDLAQVENDSALNDLKSKYLGKEGTLNEVMQVLKSASVEEKKVLGPIINEIREFLNTAISDKTLSLERKKIDEKLALNTIDITDRDSLRADVITGASFHPVSQIQREIEDIFLSMGFDVLNGPHIEDEFHNFEALNIPADHPARDMQDTFWFHDTNTPAGQRRLLRTHTSTVQVHGMMSKKPPFKFIAPGKVFRCERTDASHEMVFHQLEGMMVGEDVSVGNLIYFMKVILTEIFKKDVEVRLRPGFFPFVEPGFELDIKCLICSGKGCSVCKQVGWVELLPCGMVHPNVLRAGNIDPKKFNGFAFGLGLDRLVMMKYGIDDIRYLHSGDLRFLNQFKAY